MKIKPEELGMISIYLFRGYGHRMHKKLLINIWGGGVEADGRLFIRGITGI